MTLEDTPEGEEKMIGLAQVQFQLSNLTMELQDIEKSKVVHKHVWRMTCRSEGHHIYECPTLGNYMVTGAPNFF
jgi:hypothetical protein